MHIDDSLNIIGLTTYTKRTGGNINVIFNPMGVAYILIHRLWELSSGKLQRNNFNKAPRPSGNSINEANRQEAVYIFEDKYHNNPGSKNL